MPFLNICRESENFSERKINKVSAVSCEVTKYCLSSVQKNLLTFAKPNPWIYGLHCFDLFVFLGQRCWILVPFGPPAHLYSNFPGLSLCISTPSPFSPCQLAFLLCFCPLSLAWQLWLLHPLHGDLPRVPSPVSLAASWHCPPIPWQGLLGRNINGISSDDQLKLILFIFTNVVMAC